MTGGKQRTGSTRHGFWTDAAPNLLCDLGQISNLSVASDSPSEDGEWGVRGVGSGCGVAETQSFLPVLPFNKVVIRM